MLKAVGFYNNDARCSFNLSTYNHAWIPACDGAGNMSNNNPSVGTNNEPIEHVACELAWYIYNNWTSHGQNVKVAAHSMGGLIIRYAIQMIGHDSHFPSSLLISDVVTFSSPMGGITAVQATGAEFKCVGCLQGKEMLRDGGAISNFMTAITSNAHPNASAGTDWMMMGSLCDCDFLDWDYYCDGCSRDKHSGFSYAFWNAPHSLHNMLLAFIYYDW